MANATTPPSEMSRRKQFLETYRMAKTSDRFIGPILLGTFLVVGAVGFVIFKSCRAPVRSSGSSRWSAA